MRIKRSILNIATINNLDRKIGVCGIGTIKNKEHAHVIKTKFKWFCKNKKGIPFLKRFTLKNIKVKIL